MSQAAAIREEQEIQTAILAPPHTNKRRRRRYSSSASNIGIQLFGGRIRRESWLWITVAAVIFQTGAVDNKGSVVDAFSSSLYHFHRHGRPLRNSFVYQQFPLSASKENVQNKGKSISPNQIKQTEQEPSISRSTAAGTNTKAAVPKRANGQKNPAAVPTAKRRKQHPKRASPEIASFNKRLQTLFKKGEAVEAERMLQQRIMEEQLAWAAQQSWKGALEADRLLGELLTLQQQQPPGITNKPVSTIRADSYSYSAVINAYRRSRGGVPAAQRAQELLEQFLRDNKQRLETDVLHNSCMDAWAVSGHPQAGSKARQLLRQLQTTSDYPSPSRISYNACLKAYAKAGQVTEALELLDLMMTGGADGGGANQRINPDKVSLSTCIDALDRAASTTLNRGTVQDDHAKRAISILEYMEKTYSRTRDTSIRPDVVTYTSVLSCLSKTSDSYSIPNPAEFYQRMQQYAGCRPNAAFCNAWIHLLARTPATTTISDPTAEARAALKMLRHMKEQYEHFGNHKLKPCRVTYTAVISVWAQVATPTAATTSHQLLDELVEMWETTGDDAYLPSYKTFVSVLNAWSKSNAPDAIVNAERLLETMDQLYQRTKDADLQPNVVLYCQMFRILAAARDDRAAKRAQELLAHMNELHKSGQYKHIQPDSTTLAYFLNTLTKAGVDNVGELATVILVDVEEGYKAGMGHLKPTSHLYSAVLQAYAKSCSAAGAELAESLLQRCKGMYKAGKLHAKPNALCYNAVMDAYARSKGEAAAAERTQSLLDEMETKARSGDFDLQPNTRSYNAVILAWKNSNATEAPEKAEALLKRMNANYKNGNRSCRPDRVTLNSIIGAWAKSDRPDSAQRAQRILDFMERQASTTGDVSCQPDRISFNTCIDAFAQNGDVQAAQTLYQRMIRLTNTKKKKTGNGKSSQSSEKGLLQIDLKPDAITLTSLKNAWLKSDEEDYVKEREIRKLNQMLQRPGVVQHAPRKEYGVDWRQERINGEAAIEKGLNAFSDFVDTQLDNSNGDTT